METTRKVKVHRTNLTMSNKWTPPPKVSLAKMHDKILRYVRDAKRNEITKYELGLHFRDDIDGKDLDTLINELIRNEYITQPEPYAVFYTDDLIETVSYRFTRKVELYLKYKWNELIKSNVMLIAIISYFAGMFTPEIKKGILWLIDLRFKMVLH